MIEISANCSVMCRVDRVRICLFSFHIQVEQVTALNFIIECSSSFSFFISNMLHNNVSRVSIACKKLSGSRIQNVPRQCTRRRIFREVLVLNYEYPILYSSSYRPPSILSRLSAALDFYTACRIDNCCCTRRLAFLVANSPNNLCHRRGILCKK